MRPCIHIAGASGCGVTTLGAGLRKVNEQSGGYDANILGLTLAEADLACRRLQVRGTTCFTLAP